MQARTRYRTTRPDTAICRLEPFIRALADCPSEQRACMLWAFALRLPGVAYEERPAAFACLLQAVTRLPSAQRVEPLTELGLRIPDLPAADQSRAFHDFVGAVSEISAELQIEPLAELAFRMVAQAFPPDLAVGPDQQSGH
ncbi:hypothetical protein [Paraburkholderia aspalathi]|uniref:hypothetical protein n=1 Tax=Paraburkholderia aspalathi TaxID=1324617 RepID=UPI0038BDD54F